MAEIVPGLAKYVSDPLYRNSWMLMLITGAANLFGYLFWLLASHEISAHEIGLITGSIAAASMIVAISRLGMDYSLTRFLPQTKDPGSFFNALVAIIVLLTGVVVVGFFLGLPYISPALAFLTDWQYMLLFICYIGLTAVCDMQGTALVAIRRADLAFLQYSLLILRIPLLFVFSAHGMLGIFLVLDITYLIMLTVGAILLYRKGIPRNVHADFEEARRTSVYSFGNYVSTIIAAAPITILPILIVNVAGASQQAYFFVAYTVATLLFMVPDSITTSMFVEGSHDRPLRETAVKALKFAFLLLAPMVLAAVVFAEKILLLFSAEYSTAAWEMLQLLALSSPFYAVITVYLTVLQVRQKLVMLNFIRMAVSGLIIILGFLLLLRQGLIGIGYAWLLANGIVAAIAGWMMLSDKKW